MKKMVGFVFLICLILSFCNIVHADIYFYEDSRHKYFSEHKTNVFKLGYNIKQLTKDSQIVNLDPTSDQLLIVNNERSSTNLAIQVSKFVQNGGRSVWIVNSVRQSTADLNDILANKFGLMIESTLSAKNTKYEGKSYAPFWQDLYIGLPKTVNIYRSNSLVIGKTSKNITAIASENYKNRKITTTAIFKDNSGGEILFMCVPNFHHGKGVNQETEKPFFLDTSVYENETALERLLEWLVGKKN